MSGVFKTAVFFILISLFLIAAPAMVLYSQGYRFDFEKKIVAKTGGIFIKAEPKKTVIELDGRKIKETDLFFGSAFIENVLPGERQIKIEKEGYLPWEKKLLIRESRVAEARNVKLIKKDIVFKEFSGRVQKVFMDSKWEQALLWEEDNSLKLYNLKTGVKSQFLESKDFPLAGKIDVLGADFSHDNSKVLLKVSGGEQLNFFLAEPSLPSKLKRLSFIPPGAAEVFFNPVNSQKAVLMLDESFFSVDLARSSIDKKPFAEDAAEFAVKDDTLYILDKKGNLAGYSFLGNSLKSLTQDFLDLGPAETLKIFEIQGDILFFWQNGSLNYLDLKKSPGWREATQGSKAFALSPDQKKIAFSKEHELWALFFEEVLSEPQREKGEKVFMTRLSSPINKIIWLNNNYFLLEAGGQIFISELDNRDRAQLWPIGNFSEPKIFFDRLSQVLYLNHNASFSASSPIF